MKKFGFSTLIFAAFWLTFSCAPVNAQELTPADDAPKQNINQIRPNLLAELNLSPDQIRQIRRINQDNRILRREAQQRLREARRELDQAIYADVADENEIQIRIKAVHQAQAEVLKINASTELAVRKVLTADQLVRFREVRRAFAERAENELNQPNKLQLNNPKQKINNRSRRLRKP